MLPGQVSTSCASVSSCHVAAHPVSPPMLKRCLHAAAAALTIAAGGTAFVTTQAISWSLFAATVVLLAVMIQQLVAGVAHCFRCWAIGAGTLMVLAQAVSGWALHGLQGRLLCRPMLWDDVLCGVGFGDAGVHSRQLLLGCSLWQERCTQKRPGCMAACCGVAYSTFWRCCVSGGAWSGRLLAFCGVELGVLACQRVTSVLRMIRA